jgi:predicted dehydrogenase
MVTACDTGEQNLAAAAAELGDVALYRDYRQALSRPDVNAAIIVTPTFLHREVACCAAENGKHIFLESRWP